MFVGEQVRLDGAAGFHRSRLGADQNDVILSGVGRMGFFEMPCAWERGQMSWPCLGFLSSMQH